MRFPDDAPVTAAKRDALRERLARLGVDLARVEEQAIKAGGPGGQRVNKTSSGVRLAFALGDETVAVKWTRERSHALNRFLALRELAEEVEVRVSPATSERLRERERVRRRKDRARRRRATSEEGGPTAAGRADPSASDTAPREPDPTPRRDRDDGAARDTDDA